MVDFTVNQKYNEGVNNMELKELSKQLDKIFFAFQEAKKNKQNKDLEAIVKDLDQLEQKLINKQKNEFFDEEQKNFYETMNNIYLDNLNLLSNCKDIDNTKKLLDICILAKNEKEKTYSMMVNTYSQFLQMIKNIKKEVENQMKSIKKLES